VANLFLSKYREQKKEIWAIAGQHLTCHNGHYICSYAETVFKEQDFERKHLTDWYQQEPKLGDDPECEICGDKWLKRLMGKNCA